MQLDNNILLNIYFQNKQENRYISDLLGVLDGQKKAPFVYNDQGGFCFML